MHYFSRAIKATGKAGATVTLKDLPPFNGESFVYTTIAAKNSATATSDWTAGVDKANAFVELRHEENIAANIVKPLSVDKIYVSDPDQLRVDVAGSADGDELTLFLNGYSVFEITEYIG